MSGGGIAVSGGVGVLAAAMAGVSGLATGVQLVLILVVGTLGGGVVWLFAKVVFGPDDRPTSRLVRLITAWRRYRRSP
jgi:hypothetical protein